VAFRAFHFHSIELSQFSLSLTSPNINCRLSVFRVQKARRQLPLVPRQRQNCITLRQHESYSVGDDFAANSSISLTAVSFSGFTL
jgi:hypothetical protein